jgi:hypothetical protein
MIGRPIDADALGSLRIRLFHRIQGELQIDFQTFLLSWPEISGICAFDRHRVLQPLVGENDFSEERLRDTAGIKSPKLAD